MSKRHLRLVISNCENSQKNTFTFYLLKLKNFFECLCLSKNEKIFLIKESLIKIYKDYEDTTGIADIPYFVKADMRLSQIIKDKKLNYYYVRLKKFQSCRFN